MLFHVHVHVKIPADLDPQVRDELVGREKASSQDLQRNGNWPHIWRAVGEYANYSIFDVESNDALHCRLWLPSTARCSRAGCTRSVNRVPYAAANGGVNTLIASLAFEAVRRHHPARSPVIRIRCPMTRPILFMALDDASYITGTVLEVSGGDRG